MHLMADVDRTLGSDAAIRHRPGGDRCRGLDQLVTARMVDAMRDSMAERQLGAITAAVVVPLAAQRTALDRHGPVAAARGPRDGDGGVRRVYGDQSHGSYSSLSAGVNVPCTS